MTAQEAPTQPVNTFTIREAAALLGVSGATLRYRCARGLMHAERGPFCWWIPASEIDRLRSAGRFTPGRKPRQGGETEEQE